MVEFLWGRNFYGRLFFFQADWIKQIGDFSLSGGGRAHLPEYYNKFSLQMPHFERVGFKPIHNLLFVHKTRGEIFIHLEVLIYGHRASLTAMCPLPLLVHPRLPFEQNL